MIHYVTLINYHPNQYKNKIEPSIKCRDISCLLCMLCVVDKVTSTFNVWNTGPISYWYNKLASIVERT